MSVQGGGELGRPARMNREETLVQRLLKSGLETPPALAGYIDQASGPVFTALGIVVNFVVRAYADPNEGYCRMRPPTWWRITSIVWAT